MSDYGWFTEKNLSNVEKNHNDDAQSFFQKSDVLPKNVNNNKFDYQLETQTGLLFNTHLTKMEKTTKDDKINLGEGARNNTDTTQQYNTHIYNPINYKNNESINSVFQNDGTKKDEKLEKNTKYCSLKSNQGTYNLKNSFASNFVSNGLSSDDFSEVNNTNKVGMEENGIDKESHEKMPENVSDYKQFNFPISSSNPPKTNINNDIYTKNQKYMQFFVSNQQNANQNLFQNKVNYFIDGLNGEHSKSNIPQISANNNIEYMNYNASQYPNNNQPQWDQQNFSNSHLPNHGFVSDKNAVSPHKALLNNLKITQLQTVVFLAVLQDFFISNGHHFNRTPIINNKKVNLFFFHLYTQNIGGHTEILKWVQNPVNQNQNPWLFIGKRLHLFEGISFDNEILSKEIENEISSCYFNYLLPYEMYISTPQGFNDIQQKKIFVQKKIISDFQQKKNQMLQNQQNFVNSQSNRQPNFFIPTKNSPSTYPPSNHHVNGDPSNINVSQIYPNLSNVKNQKNVPLGYTTVPRDTDEKVYPTINKNSPIDDKSKYTGAQNFNGFKTTSNHDLNIFQNTQPSYFKTNDLSKLKNKTNSNTYGIINQKTNGKRQINQKFDSKNKEKLSNQNRSIKNQKDFFDFNKDLIYENQKDFFGGYSINKISNLSSIVESLKPNYISLLEMGNINIHSLIMEIKYYVDSKYDDVSSCLNKVLILTSHTNFLFPINDCIELLESLSSLGLKFLKKLINKNYNPKEFIYKNLNNLPTNYKIDQIFDTYVNPNEQFDENYEFFVNSITGKTIDNDISSFLLDKFDNPKKNKDIHSKIKNELFPEIQFSCLDYCTILKDSFNEDRYHFSKSETSTTDDENVLINDQLLCVTMILRNISYWDLNKKSMSENILFKCFFFSLIKNILINYKKFFSHKKVFCLLKDCLFILNSISSELRLSTLEETFFSYVLITVFGPKLNNENEVYKIPEFSFDTYPYFAYSVDTFIKLLVREPYNRSLFHAIFNESFCINSNIILNDFVIGKKDQIETKKLITAYLNNNENKSFSSELFTRSLRFFMCIIPFTMNSFESLKFFTSKSETIIQTLFCMKLLINMSTTKDSPIKLHIISVYFLIDNKDILLDIISKSSILLVFRKNDFQEKSSNSKVLTLILIKFFIVINSLLLNTLNVYKLISNNNENQNLFNEKFIDLKKKIETTFLQNTSHKNLILDIITNIKIDFNLKKEVTRFFFFLDELSSFN